MTKQSVASRALSLWLGLTLLIAGVTHAPREAFATKVSANEDLAASDIRAVFGQTGSPQFEIGQNIWDAKDNTWVPAGNLTIVTDLVQQIHDTLAAAPYSYPDETTGNRCWPLHISHVIYKTNPRYKEEALLVQTKHLRAGAGGTNQYLSLFIRNDKIKDGSNNSYWKLQKIVVGDRMISGVAEINAVGATQFVYPSVADIAYEAKSGRLVVVYAIQKSPTASGGYTAGELQYHQPHFAVWDYTNAGISAANGLEGPGFDVTEGLVYGNKTSAPGGSHHPAWIRLAPHPSENVMILAWDCHFGELFARKWDPQNTAFSASTLIEPKLSKGHMDAGGDYDTLRPFDVAIEASGRALIVYGDYANDSGETASTSTIRYRTLRLGTATDSTIDSDWLSERNLNRILDNVNDGNTWEYGPSFVTLAAEPGGSRILAGVYVAHALSGSESDNRVYAATWNGNQNTTECKTASAWSGAGGPNCWLTNVHESSDTVVVLQNAGLPNDVALIDWDARNREPRGSYPVATGWVGKPAWGFLTYSKEGGSGLDWALFPPSGASSPHIANRWKLQTPEYTYAYPEVGMMIASTPDSKRAMYVGTQFDGTNQKIMATYLKQDADGAAPQWASGATYLAGTVNYAETVVYGERVGYFPVGFGVNLGFPRFYSDLTSAPDPAVQYFGMGASPTPAQPIVIEDRAGLITKASGIRIFIPDALTMEWQVPECPSTAQTVKVTFTSSAAIPGQLGNDPYPAPDHLTGVGDSTAAAPTSAVPVCAIRRGPDNMLRGLLVGVYRDFAVNDRVVIEANDAVKPLRVGGAGGTAFSQISSLDQLGLDITADNTMDVPDESKVRIAERLVVTVPASGQAGNAFVSFPTATNVDLLKFRFTPSGGAGILVKKIEFKLTEDSGVFNDSDFSALSLTGVGSPSVVALGGANPIIQATFPGAGQLITTPVDLILKSTVGNLTSSPIDKLTVSLLAGQNPSSILVDATAAPGGTATVDLDDKGLVVTTPTAGITKQHGVASYGTVNVATTGGIVLVNAPLDVTWGPLNVGNPTTYEMLRGGTPFNVGDSSNGVAPQECDPAAPPTPSLSGCTVLATRNTTATADAKIRLTGVGNGSDTLSATSASFKVAGTLAIGEPSAQVFNALTRTGAIPSSDLFKVMLTTVGEQINLSYIEFTFSGTGIVTGDLSGLKLLQDGVDVAATFTFPGGNTIRATKAMSVAKDANSTFTLQGIVSNLAAGDAMTLGVTAAQLGTPTGQDSTVALAGVGGAVTGTVASKVHTVSTYQIASLSGLTSGNIGLGQTLGIDWQKVGDASDALSDVAIEYTLNGSGWSAIDCDGGGSGAEKPCNWTLPTSMNASAANQAKVRIRGKSVAPESQTLPDVESSAFTIVERLELANHALGQVGNALDQEGTLTDRELFRFQAKAFGGGVNMTMVTFDVSGAAVGKLQPASVRFGIDANRDGAAESWFVPNNVDTSVPNKLTLDVAGLATHTGGQTIGYILRGSFANVVGGNDFSIGLPAGQLDATGVTSTRAAVVAESTAIGSFTHQLATYVIYSPAVGANWKVGTLQTITWEPSGTTQNNVDVWFASDGVNFIKQATITSCPPAPAQCSLPNWQVPDMISAAAKIKITPAGQMSPSGTMTQPFNVHGSIGVNSPGTGDRWVVGAPHLIQWTKTGAYQQFRIEWSRAPFTFWQNVATVPGTDSSYSWTPADADASDQAQVRVVDADAAGGAHPNTEFTASNVFALPKLRLLEPRVDGSGQPDFWKIGANATIQWEAVGITNVVLQYSTDDFATTKCINSCNPVPAGSGSFLWPVPNDPAPSAKIKISEAGGTITQVSDAFHIHADLVLDAPVGGNLSVNNPFTVQWHLNAGDGVTVPSVALQASTDGFATINAQLSPGTVPNTGSFDWLPAATATAVRLRVCDARDISAQTCSAPSGTFSISGLAMESPLGGERLVAGLPWTVQWNFVGTMTNVAVELLNVDGTINKMIVPSTGAQNVGPGRGSYVWTPAAGDVAAARTIRVRDTGSAIEAVSGNIRIGTPFAIMMPAGGESWGVGTTQPLRWAPSLSADPSVTKVKIEYLTDNDGDGSFTDAVLVTTVDNNDVGGAGQLDWVVPDVPGALGDPQANPVRPFKVRVSDATPGHALDAPQVSASASAKYFKVTWEIRSATAPNPLLSALKVSDSCAAPGTWLSSDGRDGTAEFVLPGQKDHYYPFTGANACSIIWSVQDVGGVVSQESKSKAADEAAFSDFWSADRDQTRTVYIEVLSAEAIVWKVNTAYQYDAVASEVELDMWLERTGKLVDNADGLIQFGMIEIFEDGTLIRTMPQILPDAAGFFKFTWDLKRDDGTTVADGKTYFTKAIIRRNNRDFTSGGALNITIPKKILTGGGSSGGGGGGVTLGELQTELAPITTAVTTTPPGQITAAQTAIQNDIAASTATLGGQIGDVKNDTTAILGDTAVIKGDTGQLITKVDGVQAYLSDPAAGLPKVLGNQDAMATQMKAQRRGGLLNRDMELEQGETATIRYRSVDDAVPPSIRIFTPLGGTLAGPMLQVSSNLFEYSVDATELGEYRVVVSEPASTDSSGTVDSLTLTSVAARATAQGTDNIATQLTNLSTQLSTVEANLDSHLTAIENAMATQVQVDGAITKVDQLLVKWGSLTAQDLQNELAALSTQIGTPAQNADLQAALGQLTTIQNEMAKETSVQSALTSLGTLQTSLTALSTQVGTPAQAAELTNAANQIIAEIQAIPGAADYTPQLTALQGSVDAMNTAMGTPSQAAALQAVANQVTAVENAIAALPGAVDYTAQLSALQSDLTTLMADVQDPAQAAVLQSVSAQVTDVQNAIASLPGATDYTAQLQVIDAAVTEVKNQVAALPTTSVEGGDTASVLEQLELLKQSIESAEGSSAAVGLSQNAFNAASEAVKILQQLQTEVHANGGVGGPALLAQAGEQLKSASQSITVIPGKFTGEELSAQLKELAKRAQGVSTDKGYHFDSLYELSETQATDVKTVRNQVEELKALLEVQRSILERNLDQPVVKTWFEAR